MPELNNIAKKYLEIKLKDITILLKSKIHEHRYLALVILINQYKTATEEKREKIVKLYLQNIKRINNWDLVDNSAPDILGNYFLDRNKGILYKLARTDNLWEKRIAIIATLEFIRHNYFEDTLKISKILLNDNHDLIHKAVGWMLREVGKRSLETEINFLKKHYQKMPRTMLRYAIEKFPEDLRLAYLKGTV